MVWLQRMDFKNHIKTPLCVSLFDYFYFLIFAPLLYFNSWGEKKPDDVYVEIVRRAVLHPAGMFCPNFFYSALPSGGRKHYPQLVAVHGGRSWLLHALCTFSWAHSASLQLDTSSIIWLSYLMHIKTVEAVKGLNDECSEHLDWHNPVKWVEWLQTSLLNCQVKLYVVGPFSKLIDPWETGPPGDDDDDS